MALHLLKAARQYRPTISIPWQVLCLLAVVFFVTLHSYFGIRILLYTTYDATPLDPISRWGALPSTVFDFASSQKPEWLLPPSPAEPSTEPNATRPLSLRVAIITHPKDVDERKAFREYILSYLPANEVKIDYQFIVGYAGASYGAKMLQERREHKDILILDMDEGKKMLGEKRWRMLQWAAEVPASQYDYYMSVDSDAFVRFTALARRLRSLELATHPGSQSILWGHMNRHSEHFLPSSDESHPERQDDQLPKGHPDKTWYDYPLGYGYLFSAALVERLTAPGLVLPHHVRYPLDDVLIGNWVADWAKGTEIVDDRKGFHDALGHSARWTMDLQKAVDWDSVVVHKLGWREMRGLRYREEFAGEWEDSLLKPKDRSS